MAVAAALSQGAAQSTDDPSALNRQVVELYQAGKYAEAIPIAERYVAAAKKEHGEEHVSYATAIAWLAELYRAQGRYAEAEPFLKRSLIITDKALGPDHLDVAAALNRLAVLYWDSMPHYVFYQRTGSTVPRVAPPESVPFPKILN